MLQNGLKDNMAIGLLNPLSPSPSLTDIHTLTPLQQLLRLLIDNARLNGLSLKRFSLTGISVLSNKVVFLLAIFFFKKPSRSGLRFHNTNTL
jgi:hypothetical protein